MSVKGFVKRRLFDLTCFTVYFASCIYVMGELYTQGIRAPILLLIGIALFSILLVLIGYMIEKEDEYIKEQIDLEVIKLQKNVQKITERARNFNDKL